MAWDPRELLELLSTLQAQETQPPATMLPPARAMGELRGLLEPTPGLVPPYLPVQRHRLASPRPRALRPKKSALRPSVRASMLAALLNPPRAYPSAVGRGVGGALMPDEGAPEGIVTPLPGPPPRPLLLPDEGAPLDVVIARRRHKRKGFF